MGKTPAQEMARKLKATKKLMNDERKKTKCKEDFAFGLKNSGTGQGKINADRLRAQAANAGRTKEQIAADEKKKEVQREKSKMKKLGWTEEEILMGKKCVDQKAMKQLAPGVDPKTVLCGFFKAGKCKQGMKCKFSHNMDIERQGKNKKSLYAKNERLTDTMDKWDQEKLETVIGQREMTNPNATQIVCHHFLEAIETKKYGWFWKCENGDFCLYQHCLPPGFILKSDLQDEEKAKQERDICEYVEQERAKLDPLKGTPVTLENFMVWKEKAKKKKEEEMIAEALKVTKAKGKTKLHRSGMTGRALFTFRPNLFQDDLDAADDEDYVFEGDEEEKDENKDETKIWKSEEAVIDEAQFLEALKLHEEGDKEEPEDKEEDMDVAAEEEEKPAEEAAPVEEVKPVEPELTPAEKKAALAVKREEKRKAKLAAKVQAKVKPMTAFEKKKLGLA